jgi:hypothetical protein
MRITQSALPENLSCREHDPANDEQRADPDEDHARMHETLPMMRPWQA